ncbi:MAG: hypothetical protein AB8F74_19570 [Saprospiraceae bacterium]
MNESPLAKNSYYEQVHLMPFNESYLQITNTSTGISFQSNYTAYIVNCANDELLDITNHVFISEFTSSTGLNQIAFEIVNIPEDFGYETLYLRIESNTNSEYVFWSSPFICTEDGLDFTNRYDYWSDYYYRGVDYTAAQKKQSIRLSTYKNQDLDELEITQYTDIIKEITVAPRVIIKEFTEYFIDEFNSYFLRRLNVLLTHQYVYIDCVSAEYSTALEFSERIEHSNIINTRFVVNLDESNTFNSSYQIYPSLGVVSLFPNSSYTAGNVPENALITFNQDVIIETGEINIYKGGVLAGTWNQSNLLQPTSNSVQIDDNLNLYANTIETYHFTIDSSLFKSQAGEFYAGISDTVTWTFNIQAGEYDETEYNNDEYVTDEPLPGTIFSNEFNETFG